MGTIVETFAAGETKTLPGGRYFHVLKTTSPIDLQFVKEQRRVEEASQVEAGFVRRSPCQFVEVTSASAQTIKVWVSDGDGEYNRTVGDVTIIEADDATAVDDIAGLAPGATATVAANPARYELHVYTDQPLKWGTGAAVGKGVRIPAGVNAVINCTGAITFYNAGGGNALIELTELS